MYMNLEIQAERDVTLPPHAVKTFTGSALPLELGGIPSKWAGGEVTGVSVTVTNANGLPIVGTCALVDGEWMVLFAASSFANYGHVEKGVKIDVSVKRADGSTAVVTLAAADLDIVRSSAASQPGTPGTFYVVKGDRCFERSVKVGDVQHYVERTMAYDPAIGWGAVWSGDFILDASGNFVSVEEV